MVLWKIKKPNSLRKHAEVMSFPTTSSVFLSSVCMLYKSSGRDVSRYYANPMLTVDLHHKPKARVRFMTGRSTEPRSRNNRIRICSA